VPPLYKSKKMQMKWVVQVYAEDGGIGNRGVF